LIPTTNLPIIAITPGEPGGVGPDLCVMLTQRSVPARLVMVADSNLLRERARLLNLPFNATTVDADDFHSLPDAQLIVVHVPMANAARPGVLDAANASYVLRTLEIAARGCMQGMFDAMTTGPVHKATINNAGFSFTGHTEFLAEFCAAKHVVMMLVGGGLRVALATTHVALRDVASQITRDRLEATIRVIHGELSQRFAINQPRIAIAGLNPHAGESGHLGREEIEVIGPALDKLQHEGYFLTGPLPADTLFNPERLAGFDCILAMYHDQGLPVLKYASFGGGVNITLGLPIIRTSVDHGTAIELAGTGKATPGSLLEAVKLAAELATRARNMIGKGP
jgi:4-hydroxythreonine-4-phosphate dehydrogenase